MVVRLWRHMSPRRHTQTLLLLFLMLFAALTEILSIGAILTFLSAMTTPEKILAAAEAKPFLHFFGIERGNQLMLPITIAFGFSALITGGTRLLLLWANTKLAAGMAADLTIDVYRKTLYQPYSVHIARNSSEISGGTGKAKAIVSTVVTPLLSLAGSALIMISIMFFLVAVDPVVSISAFFGFGLIYVIIGFWARKRLSKYGKILSREGINTHKALTEGLGGIRDILLDGSQDVYCEIYRASDWRLTKATAESTVISGSPRFAIEGLSMILLAIFAYVLAIGSSGLTDHVPLLGALALGAQRILPMMQAGYLSWTTLKLGEASLDDVLNLLDQPLPDYATGPAPPRLPFAHSIQLADVSFQYWPDGPFVLKHLDLEIKKGSRVGFVGTTGSGKSTLLDIVMGLLRPTLGSLVVDGTAIEEARTVKSWQRNIAHVPQAIFLSDSSIAENIAFGVHVDKIDRNAVIMAAQQAQIASHIETLEHGYDTRVGERGVRLSGGQRQRIGIARALYKQASVIVFDEATSALDTETERAVMEAIDGLAKDLTVLIIAHRLSTIRNCDKIVELSAGEIQRIGTYDELFGHVA